MRWQNNHYRPTLELLERRDLPTTATLAGGVLTVVGTSGNDYISVAQSDGRIYVHDTAITVGKSHVSSVAANQVNHVVVYGNGGNDVINLRPSAATTLTKDATVYVGAGDSQVYGGAGGNYLVATGSGHHTLVGGPGTDYLAGTATDTLDGGGGFDWFYRPYNPSNPFPAGEHVSDVRQGHTPSCQTVAALAEAVQQGHNFASDIHYLGNNTYDVSLYGGTVHERVFFNGWYNSDDPTPTVPGEFWTVLMYRARLEALHINPTAHYTTAQWDAENLRQGGRVYSNAEALYAFTGRTATFAPMSAVTPYGMQYVLSQGAYVVASTPAGGGASADGIVRDHAYAVMDVYWDAGMWKVRLYNPWGFDGFGGRTIESLAGGTPKNNGFITVSWSQFVSSANFAGVTLATPTAAQTAYFKLIAGTDRE